MATITAKFPGVCSVCGQAVKVGQRIEYVKGQPTRHADCKPPTVPADAIRLSGGSGYGCEGWKPGEVVANPGRRHGATKQRQQEREEALRQLPSMPTPPRAPYKMGSFQFPDGYRWGENPNWEAESAAFAQARAAYDEAVAERKRLEKEIEVRLPLDGPEYLLVLTASSRYIREDGMSFGVGDESGHVYDAVCRPATEEESRPLREAQEKARVRHEAGQELKQLADHIRKAGECPEGSNVPEGEEIVWDGADSRIYGGGRWFVIGPEWIWSVTNNGHDGDDWSCNNVRTGGAGALGALGSRVPFSQDLADQIRRLAKAAS